MHTYFCGSYTTAWARSGVPCMLQVDEKIKFLEFCLKHNLCNTSSFGQILGKYFAFMSRDKKLSVLIYLVLGWAMDQGSVPVDFLRPKFRVAHKCIIIPIQICTSLKR